MEYYKLINELDTLQEFVNWLPDLEEHEGYLLALFARSKYCSTIKGDNVVLRQVLIRDKKRFINRIKQMECIFGAYETRNGEPVPSNSLAVYVTINPCSLRRTKIKLAHRLIESIDNKTYHGKNGSITAMYYSELQRCRSRSNFVNFDIDYPKEMPDLTNILNDEAYTILQTRGGWHILVSPSHINNEFQKTWYREMQDLSDDKNELIPVPGCSQGGFTPKFI